MRIIAGQWRGRPLIAPKGDTTRPTADRTREALFSMLNSRLGTFEGLRVADLFAGSGALGLEALSRGAAHCTFVEQDGVALDTLRANILKLGASDRSEVRAQSVMALGSLAFHLPPRTDLAEPGEALPFDKLRANGAMAYHLVFLDPPYGTGAGSVALYRLLRLGWLAPGALASVETSKRETVEITGFKVEAERAHSNAKINLLRFIG